MLEGEDLLGIWLAADEFMLDDLEKQVRELFEKKEEKLKTNFMSIVRLVYQNDALERFRSNCVDIINTTTWFQDSCDFETLEESVFQSLLSEEENYDYSPYYTHEPIENDAVSSVYESIKDANTLLETIGIRSAAKEANRRINNTFNKHGMFTYRDTRGDM